MKSHPSVVREINPAWDRRACPDPPGEWERAKAKVDSPVLAKGRAGTEAVTAAVLVERGPNPEAAAPVMAGAPAASRVAPASSTAGPAAKATRRIKMAEPLRRPAAQAALATGLLRR